MASIELITIDNAESTFRNDLLSIESVDEFAKELVTEVGGAIDEWISTLEEEMSNGGLSSQALVIGGDPILYSYAASFVRDLESRKAMLENARTKILNQARQHRCDELHKLETVLEENKEWHNDRIKAIYKESKIYGPGYKADEVEACGEKITWANNLITEIRADECYGFSGGE